MTAHPDEGVEPMVKRMAAADRDWAPLNMTREQIDGYIDAWFANKKARIVHSSPRE